MHTPYTSIWTFRDTWARIVYRTKYTLFLQDSHSWALSLCSLASVSHCPSISAPSPPFHAALKAGPWSVCHGLACFVTELRPPLFKTTLPTCPSFLFLLSLPSFFEGFFHTWEGQNSSQQLIFSILVKWSPFTNSPLHLSVLIAPVYRAYNSLCTLLADIVADIERLSIMSPCFTLQLKLHCLVCYVLLTLQSWLCIPFSNTVFECHIASCLFYVLYNKMPDCI